MPNLKKHCKVLFFTCLCFITCQSLQAQETEDWEEEEDLEDFFGGEEMIKIATGELQHISKAPAVASVITALDIKKMGANDLDEVLESVPGLHVSLSSVRYSSTYQIRGIATDTNPQVLMLINGTPMTQLYFGDRGTNPSFPIKSIERIEVIRGPGSAIYGADAFSGVINIITKKARDASKGNVGVRKSSFNTNDLWFNHSGKIKDFNYLVSLSLHETDGDEDRMVDLDLQSIFDGLMPGASLAPGVANTRQKRSDLRLELSKDNWNLKFWNLRQDDLGTGAGVALALDPEGYTDIDNYFLDYQYHNKNIAKDWDLDLKVSYMDVNFESLYVLFPPGTILPIGPDGNISPFGNPIEFTGGFIGAPSFFEEHARIDVSSFYKGFTNHSIRLAAGASQASLTPEELKNFGPGVLNGTETTVDNTLTNVTNTPFIYVRDEERTIYYLSLQDEWTLAPDWRLTTGLRYDDYSDFGSTVNPRLALVWNAGHNFTTKFLYGRAFRAPSFAESFAENNPVVLGNPDLEPEIINTFELAFDYRPNLNVTLDLSLFSYRVKDLIKFVANQDGSSTAANIGKQSGDGLEFEFKWKLSNFFTIQGNYAYQNAQDENTDSDVPNTPQQQFYLNNIWKIDNNWLFSLQFNHVADRKRLTNAPGLTPTDPLRNDPRAEIDDYSNTNVTLRRTSDSGNWTYSLKVSNIGNERQFEPSPANLDLPTGSAVPNDFILEGRSFSLEVDHYF